MNPETVISREAKAILKRMARETGFRTDTTIHLKTFEPSVLARGSVFGDKDDPRFQRSRRSELSYSYNTLRSLELIRTTVKEGPPHETQVFLTYSGVELARELSKSWLRRAIDKQPMTFLQVVFSLVNLIFFVANLYFASEGKR